MVESRVSQLHRRPCCDIAAKHHTTLYGFDTLDDPSIPLFQVFHTSYITLGVRALSYPWAILGGAYIVSGLMSYTKGHVRILFISATIMTAFTAALANSTPDNAVFTVTMATFAAFGNGALVRRQICRIFLHKWKRSAIDALTARCLT